MRIVLDLQGCQSPGSRVRGIGRYSMALALAMARNPRGHEIWIGLNGAFPETVEPIRGAFKQWIPQDRIVVWETVGPVAEADPRNSSRRWVAECLREDFLAQLRPDIVHVSTLFEGWADDVTASVGRSGTPAHLTALTLYDLIPLARQDSYLGDPRVKAWYYGKLECLKKAEILLAISQFAAEEAVDLLGLPPERIFNISAAADGSFRRLEMSPENLWKTCAHYGIQRPYVMYTGGMDPRKNLRGLIAAYAELPAETRRGHQLVITGTASPDEMKDLRSAIADAGLESREVVLAGYVPDSDLVALYNACRLYVFPSFHEGFGLPALEAMACGAVVIGADATSLPEVIGHPSAMFDPLDKLSISACMLRALADDGLRSELLEHARNQIRKFSWESSAEKALQAFELMHQKREQAARGVVQMPAGQARPRVAVMPLVSRPERDGNAPSLMTMLDELSKPFHITVLVADQQVRQQAVNLGIECLTYSASAAELAAFDAVLCEVSTLAGCEQAVSAASLSRPIFYVHGEPISISPATIDPVLASEIRLAERGYAQLQKEGASDSGSALAVGPWLRSRANGWVEGVQGHESCETSRMQVGRVIEAVSEGIARGATALCRKLMAALDVDALDERDLRKTAAAVALNKAMPRLRKQLLVDVSYLVERDTRTGVQRVVYKVLNELLRHDSTGYLVEPVYFDPSGLMRYARQFCWKLLGLSRACPPDDVVEPAAGDLFLGLDLAPDFVSRNGDRFTWLRNRGVRIHFVVYDLLPVLRPECFDSEVGKVFEHWARVVADVADGVLCISRSVADEFRNWLDASEAVRHRPLRIGYFHLGADLESASAEGQHTEARRRIAEGKKPLQFLMVSTVEPRKGHAQTLDAFELLWSEGSEARLVIVGKAGWMVNQLIERIKKHAEFGQRLIWIDHADDAQLIDLYRSSACLLVPSEGEGFGLPLIEAARYGLPLICRDIPVFREVAGEHAIYFDGYEAASLADALRAWVVRWAAGTLPDAGSMPTLTWHESTQQLLGAMLSGEPYASWSPGGSICLPAFDRRLYSEVGDLLRGAIHSRGKVGQLVRGAGIRVPRGHYRIRVFGQLEGDASGCWFELWAGSSRELLKAERLQSAATLLLETTLELGHDAGDVEFAIRVSRSARVDFRGLDFHLRELGEASL